MARQLPRLSNHLLQFFENKHLPAKLQTVSDPFAGLAHFIDKNLPQNPESTTAIRKLLEAKDCAVRAVLYNNHVTNDAQTKNEKGEKL